MPCNTCHKCAQLKAIVGSHGMRYCPECDKLNDNKVIALVKEFLDMQDKDFYKMGKLWVYP